MKKTAPTPQDITKALKEFMENQELMTEQKTRIDNQNTNTNISKIHPFDYVNEKPEVLKDFNFDKSVGFVDKIRNSIKKFFSKGNILLVEMELNDGDFTMFYVSENDGGFKFRGKKYIFDHKSKDYIKSISMYRYTYHESFVLPIIRQIPVQKLRNSISPTEEYPDIRLATNPQSLEFFVTSKIAEGIMKGAGLEAFLRRLFLVTIIILIILICLTLMFMFKTGMFQSVKLPFFG